MIEIVWQFEVDADHVSQFEEHYGPKGTWDELFSLDKHFEGVRLLKDVENEGRYLTIDSWTSLKAFRAFKAKYESEYSVLDDALSMLTLTEKYVGIFEAD